ncbi:MAG: hypothetical protein JEZ04_02365 [Spirochaetales bacterium]|nr:hypothetical protein [Spirochaetales bacterium]
MFKLIFFLIGLAVTIILSAFNLGNSTDFSFGFRVLKNAPVFLIVLTSFLAGAVFTLPFAFVVSFNNRKTKKRKSRESFVDDAMPADFTPAESDEPKPE